MNAVNVKISFLKEPIKIVVTEDTTVEDVVIELCKCRNISPVTRFLFALRRVVSGTWMDFSSSLWQEKTPEFVLRYNVPSVDRLKDIDENAYEFYFRQARHHVLQTVISESKFNSRRNDLIRLSVLDMFRTTIEDGWTVKKVIQNYKKYVPRIVKRKDRTWLKKQVLKQFQEILLTNIRAAYVKKEYLERVRKIFPYYLSEEYCGFLQTDVNVNEMLIRVHPFDAEFPGVAIRYENKEKWEHFCTIDELVYLTSDESIGLIRKNGVPLYVKLSNAAATTSFVTSVSGYYRLMVNWTFNLCKDYQIPSLRKLRLLKCHGPVGCVKMDAYNKIFEIFRKEFARQKLLEKRNYKTGCYILRESEKSYDCYYVDVCTEIGEPITHKIEKTKRNMYKLEESKNEYSTLPQLLKEEKWENMGIELQECIPPSDYDRPSSLLICRIENMWYTNNNEFERMLTLNTPQCINSRTVLRLKNMSSDRNSVTTIHYGVWNNTPTTKREVIIKQLRENQEKQVTEFLSLINRWAFLNSGSIVKLYGAILADPLSMIMEYLPLGQLNVYLANPANRSGLNELTLMEASVSLANALYNLEEAQLVHGYIRCRKLLVGGNTKSSFIVKLADPGLRTLYKDTDLYWIPPELHSNMNGARSSFAADVWAFATTLWEVFSYGALPSAEGSSSIKKFYSESFNYLPRPTDCPLNVYNVMLECWNYDTDARKKPQAIMRDINQIFYRVYNDKTKFNYDEIDSIKPVGILDDSFEQTVNDIRNSQVNNEESINPYSELQESSTDQENVIYYEPDFSKVTIHFLNNDQHTFQVNDEWTLNLDGLIKQGHYADMYKGELFHLNDHDKRKAVAVKKMKEVVSDCKSEIEILKQLHHPNIVRMKGIIQDPKPLLILEFAELGSLQEYLILNERRLTIRRLLKFSLDTAMGMNYLRNMKIIHRNLSAKHILVVDDTRVKVSNFGLARLVKNENYENYCFLKTEPRLPIKWYAPETLEYGRFSFQSDVWSYGITLWEIFSYGVEPELPNVKNTVYDWLKALKENIRLVMPSSCPEYIYTNLIFRCWNYDAHLRPSFDELIEIITEICPLQLQRPKREP